MKLKNFLFVLALVLIALSSCKDNGTQIKVSDFLEMRAAPLPDTMYLDQTYNISVTAIIPNSCWEDVSIVKHEFSDSSFQFYAMGTFYNDGENCIAMEALKDSVFRFSPEVAKTHLFAFFSKGQVLRVDTVVVLENQP